MFIQCDVSKSHELQHVVDATIEKFGQLDCLINNAWVARQFARLRPKHAV